MTSEIPSNQPIEALQEGIDAPAVAPAGDVAEPDTGQVLLDSLSRRQALVQAVVARRSWRPSLAGGPAGTPQPESPMLAMLARLVAFLPPLLERASFRPVLEAFARRESDWTAAQLFWWQRYSPVEAMLSRGWRPPPVAAALRRTRPLAIEAAVSPGGDGVPERHAPGGSGGSEGLSEPHVPGAPGSEGGPEPPASGEHEPEVVYTPWSFAAIRAALAAAWRRLGFGPPPGGSRAPGGGDGRSAVEPAPGERSHDRVSPRGEIARSQADRPMESSPVGPNLASVAPALSADTRGVVLAPLATTGSRPPALAGRSERPAVSAQERERLSSLIGGDERSGQGEAGPHQASPLTDGGERLSPPARARPDTASLPSGGERVMAPPPGLLAALQAAVGVLWHHLAARRSSPAAAAPPTLPGVNDGLSLPGSTPGTALTMVAPPGDSPQAVSQAPAGNLKPLTMVAPPGDYSQAGLAGRSRQPDGGGAERVPSPEASPAAEASTGQPTEGGAAMPAMEPEAAVERRETPPSSESVPPLLATWIAERWYGTPATTLTMAALLGDSHQAERAGPRARGDAPVPSPGRVFWWPRLLAAFLGAPPRTPVALSASPSSSLAAAPRPPASSTSDLATAHEGLDRVDDLGERSLEKAAEPAALPEPGGETAEPAGLERSGASAMPVPPVLVGDHRLIESESLGEAGAALAAESLEAETPGLVGLLLRAAAGGVWQRGEAIGRWVASVAARGSGLSMCWQVRDGRPSMLDATPLHEHPGGYLAGAGSSIDYYQSAADSEASLVARRAGAGSPPSATSLAERLLSSRSLAAWRPRNATVALGGTGMAPSPARAVSVPSLSAPLGSTPGIALSAMAPRAFRQAGQEASMPAWLDEPGGAAAQHQAASTMPSDSPDGQQRPWSGRAAPVPGLPPRPWELGDDELARVILNLPKPMAAAAIAAGVLDRPPFLSARLASREGHMNMNEAFAGMGGRNGADGGWGPAPERVLPPVPGVRLAAANEGAPSSGVSGTAGERAVEGAVPVPAYPAAGWLGLSASPAQASMAAGIFRAEVNRPEAALAARLPGADEPGEPALSQETPVETERQLDRLVEEVYDRLRWRLGSERERLIG